ncbi:MAG: exopolyphosphatase, partial [Desulfovibrionaceae bacterium]
MRLVTRSDFDGLACAALLTEAGVVDDYLYTHPKDLQDGKVAVGENDVLANVPYVPGCGLWFDHHSSETERLGFDFQYEGASRQAPSCARVVYDYYKKDHDFPDHIEEMVQAVDKVDSASLAHEDIRNPQGWVLLGFIMDPRTGLGRIHAFRISNFELMKRMPRLIAALPLEKIMDDVDVKERVEVYRREQELFERMLQENSSVHGELVVLDLLDREVIHAGNRFLLYDLHPQCNISMTLLWGKQKQNVVFSVGHSILNRSSQVDVGSLMLRYGGGGHRAVGTCQVDSADAGRVKQELISAIVETTTP